MSPVVKPEPGKLDKLYPVTKLEESSTPKREKKPAKKIKLKPPSPEAIAVSQYVIEKVLLPKVFSTWEERNGIRPSMAKKTMLPKPKKKKAKPKPVEEPPPEPEPTHKEQFTTVDGLEEMIAKAAKALAAKLKKIADKRGPTHKEQCTTTEDLEETIAQVEKAANPPKRSSKVKSKTAVKSKGSLEAIAEPNADLIATDSNALADIQGGGGGDLIINEITVRFCRRIKV